MPQLNPEFFISQIFWLVITFTFLFVFLWRISLPRIGKVLEKRSDKINDDIKLAKIQQAEAEEIQKKINSKLIQARIETSELIKNANIELQNHASNELDKIDSKLNTKLAEATSTIEKSKLSSINEIDNQIYEITKLTLSKLSKIQVNDNEIKDIVTNIQKKVVN
jgi:F-type H+-transporting ATPase subunit b